MLLLVVYIVLDVCISSQNTLSNYKNSLIKFFLKQFIWFSKGVYTQVFFFFLASVQTSN